MRLFVLMTLLTASASLLLVDLKIRRFKLNKEQVSLERRLQLLEEKRVYIQAEIDRELGSPALRAYLLEGRDRDERAARVLAERLNHANDRAHAADASGDDSW